MSMVSARSTTAGSVGDLDVAPSTYLPVTVWFL